MKAMKIEFEDLFIGDDMRMPNGAIEASEICLQSPQRILELLELIKGGTPKYKLCASDALEKISVQRPELLRQFESEIFEIACSETQQEVRWHMAQIAPRLDLNLEKANEWVTLLRRFLNDKSRIVVTFAMNAIWEISQRYEINGARELIEKLAEKGPPSVKARARKLLNP